MSNNIEGVSTPQTKQEILSLLEERKLRYQADQKALQHEMRAQRKSYNQFKVEMNRQLKAIQPSGIGSPKKDCHALNRQIGQLLLAFDGGTLDTANAVSKFDLQAEKAVFTISINIQKRSNYVA